jgi:hypothetical protein
MLNPDGIVSKSYSAEYQLVPLCLALRQRPGREDAPSLAEIGLPPLLPGDTAVFLGLSNFGSVVKVLPNQGQGVDEGGKRVDVATGVQPLPSQIAVLPLRRCMPHGLLVCRCGCR